VALYIRCLLGKHRYVTRLEVVESKEVSGGSIEGVSKGLKWRHGYKLFVFKKLERGVSTAKTSTHRVLLSAALELKYRLNPLESIG
jgi:hypothetical protein